MPTVEANGIETYYERHGEGPPLVCLPGGGFDHRSWYPQVEGLSDEFELILLDPRGHGKTGYEENEGIGIDVLASDLSSFIDQLGLQQPAVMGCSLGGLVAHAYATEEPSDVGALVLHEAPVGNSDVPLPMRMWQLFQLWGSRVLSPDRIFAFQQWINSHSNGSDEWADQRIPHTSLTKDEYLDDAFSRIDSEVMVRGGSMLQYEATNLETITSPTLVLTGEQPGEFFKESAAEFTNRIPMSRYERVPNAGHLGHIDNPEVFNEMVSRFLREVYVGKGAV